MISRSTVTVAEVAGSGGQGCRFFPDLHPVSEADEQAATDAGTIQATGIHYLGTKR